MMKFFMTLLFRATLRTLKFSFLRNTALSVSAYMSAKTSQRYSKPGQHWVSAIACLKIPDYQMAQCGIH